MDLTWRRLGRGSSRLPHITLRSLAARGGRTIVVMRPLGCETRDPFGPTRRQCWLGFRNRHTKLAQSVGVKGERIGQNLTGHAASSSHGVCFALFVGGFIHLAEVPDPDSTRILYGTWFFTNGVSALGTGAWARPTCAPNEWSVRLDAVPPPLQPHCARVERYADAGHSQLLSPPHFWPVFVPGFCNFHAMTSQGMPC